MNVKRTSSFAPSQPSLSLQGCWNRGWLGRFFGSCSIMFVNVCLCLFISVHSCSKMFVYVCSCSFMFIHVHLCSFTFIHVHSRSFTFIHVHSRSFIFVYVHSFCFMFVHFCASLFMFVLVFSRNNAPLILQTLLRSWGMASFWLVGRRSKTNLYNDVSLK